LPKLKLTQVRSQIGQTERHRGTLRARPGRIGKTNEIDDSPVLAACCARCGTSSTSRDQVNGQ
jgi:ribosomal protein L30/L7E